MERNYDVITFISKYLYFKKAGLATFADIKIGTMFIKTTFKDPKEVKRIRNYLSKWDLYLHFLIQQNLLISGQKCRCQQNSRSMSRDSYIFWILLR